MKRGLFLSFFIRIALALGLVALMRVWFTPRGWILGTALVIGWAAINAFFLARSVRENIVRLQTSTAAIPNRHVGVIDPGYRGEIKIVITNLTPNPIQIAPGDRIAQLRIVQRIEASFEEVSEISEAPRGASGFGSTGI